jgi:hypothetical protein
VRRWLSDGLTENGVIHSKCNCCCYYGNKSSLISDPRPNTITSITPLVNNIMPRYTPEQSVLDYLIDLTYFKVLSGAIDQMTQIPHKLVHVSVAISVEILLDHFQVGSVLEADASSKRTKQTNPILP